VRELIDAVRKLIGAGLKSINSSAKLVNAGWKFIGARRKSPDALLQPLVTAGEFPFTGAKSRSSAGKFFSTPCASVGASSILSPA
jgi:hypothetical protein